MDGEGVTVWKGQPAVGKVRKNLLWRQQNCSVILPFLSANETNSCRFSQLPVLELIAFKLWSWTSHFILKDSFDNSSMNLTELRSGVHYLYLPGHALWALIPAVHLYSSHSPAQQQALLLPSEIQSMQGTCSWAESLLSVRKCSSHDP